VRDREGIFSSTWPALIPLGFHGSPSSPLPDSALANLH
jgi:hypothetical protein